ncbi:MAG: DUF2264 domain-containing protein [Planctomycetota bacterium]
MTLDPSAPVHSSTRLLADAPRGIEAFEWFAQQAEALLKPLMPRMIDGRSVFDLPGRESSHGPTADRLEAFARPALLAMLWLQTDRNRTAPPRRDAASVQSPDHAPCPTRVANWLLDAIRMGSDPDHDEYWGNLTNYHQHAVEMAIMAMGLEEAQDQIWKPLDAPTKTSLASWLGQIRGHAGHANNHWFFDVLVLEFLLARGMGEPGDDVLIAHLMDELERMYRGDGWFIDGCNETYDHYNAFSFHTYGLFWARRYGHTDPIRRDRWLGMAHEFIESYARLFASSGEPVPVGRSLTYRFNAVSVLPLAAAMGVGTLPPGELRRLARQGIEYFRGVIDESRPLPVGWTDHFETFAEPYSCEASPYWASKAFFALTLDPSEPFFVDEESQFACEREDDSHVIKPPGWVVRHRAGEAEIIAAGVRCAPSAAARFGPWKWGRLATRTGVGWLTPARDEGYPADASLTARPPEAERWFGRQVSMPIDLSKDHASCVYALGGAEDEFHINVRTSMWWNAGWIFALHDVRCWQPSVVRHGGYALPLGAAELELDHAPGFARLSASGRHASLQIVAGFDPHLTIDHATSDHTNARRHLTTHGHALAIAHTGSDDAPIEGAVTCAVLFGTTTDLAEAVPWTIDQTADGWDLSHPKLGPWSVTREPIVDLEAPSRG